MVHPFALSFIRSIRFKFYVKNIGSLFSCSDSVTDKILVNKGNQRDYDAVFLTKSTNSKWANFFFAQLAMTASLILSQWQFEADQTILRKSVALCNLNNLPGPACYQHRLSQANCQITLLA